jgi:hypothetical protein
MQEEADGKPTGDPPPQPMGPLASLPRASEELEREDLHPTLLPELGDDHKQRFHEAFVKEQETHAKQADDDREMRKEIAERVFLAISVQVLIADIAFFIYGFANDWHIPDSAINVWLGAAVVQVIAVGMVIARSLFPSTPRRHGPRLHRETERKSNG